ncbi:hypothetical protein Lal_00021853 [Lupinus albus]|nr:hypothetical protein Lal_00021853 [Lupinus albus]
MVSHVLKINPTYPKQVREEEEELGTRDTAISVIDYKYSRHRRDVIDYQHGVIDYIVSDECVIDYTVSDAQEMSRLNLREVVVDLPNLQSLYIFLVFAFVGGGAVVYMTCNNAVKAYHILLHSHRQSLKVTLFSICFNTVSIESLFLVCNGQWSPQVKGVLVAAIINTINIVWFCRNLKRFDDKKMTLVQAKSRIMLTTSLAGNNSKEGNTCADRLASFGVSSKVFTWWDVIPRFIFEDFNKNRLGLPNYRCNFLLVLTDGSHIPLARLLTHQAFLLTKFPYSPSSSSLAIKLIKLSLQVFLFYSTPFGYKRA